LKILRIQNLTTTKNAEEIIYNDQKVRFIFVGIKNEILAIYGDHLVN